MSTRVPTSRARASGAFLARAAAAVVVVCLALPAAARAQSTQKSHTSRIQPDPSPVMNALRQVSQTYEQNLIGSAKEMPADKYSYKPTDKQRTFGALMLHVAMSNEFMCSAISGQPEPKGAQLEPTSPKNALVTRLQKSFSYCTNVLAKMNDSGLDQQVPFFGGRKVSRAAAVMTLAEDWADHYGQAAMYLRLNGMLPPSAQRRGGM